MPKRRIDTQGGRANPTRARRDSNTVMYNRRAVSNRPMVRSGPGLVRRALTGVASKAARAVPYLGTALDVYDAGKLLFGRKAAPKKGMITTSKSAGKFGKARNLFSKMDKHVKNGVVLKTEFTGVRQDNSNPVIYFAQSTAPSQKMLEAALGALLKKLYFLSGVTIKSFDAILADSQNYSQRIQLWHKKRDGDTVVKYEILVGTTDTLSTLVFAWRVYLQSLAGDNMPDQFLKIQLYDVFTAVPTGYILKASIDLTQATCAFDTKSTLKLQNRCINSTGNDTADDVDNVPLVGKYYEYKTNGTVYQDFATPGVANYNAITTHPIWGTLNAVTPMPDYTSAANRIGTGMYDEIPLQSQFVGCKKSGKAKLDPGEIKTSVLSDQITISFAQLIKKCFVKSNTSTGGAPTQYTQVWLGKTRLFALEKMIGLAFNAAINQYDVAYEHQIDIGCTFSFKRDNITAPQVTLRTTPFS